MNDSRASTITHDSQFFVIGISFLANLFLAKLFFFSKNAKNGKNFKGNFFLKILFQQKHAVGTVGH